MAGRAHDSEIVERAAAGTDLTSVRIPERPLRPLLPLVAGWMWLRLDEERKKGMRVADARLVTALTWPLLVEYGYLGDGK